VSTAVGQERRRLGVRLLTPEGAVFDDLAYMVIAPSVEGEVGILPRHTPFIAFLRHGEVRLKLLDDTELIYATTEGYVSVEEDRVLILTEQAEKADEIDAVMDDLVAIGCDIMTIGQYLQPTPKHLPVARWVHPDEFAKWKEVGEAKGLRHVESGPLVRSSYHADRHLPAKTA